MAEEINEVNRNEISKDKYFSKLSTLDRANLITIIPLFKKIVEDKGYNISLFAVGGSVVKEQPRKDIDIVVVFEDSDKLPKRQSFKNQYVFADSEYKLLDEVVKNLTKDLDVIIIEAFPPAIDEEFENPNILKHDGTLKIQFPKGTPIEFLRINTRGADNFIQQQTKPFVRL